MMVTPDWIVVKLDSYVPPPLIGPDTIPVAYANKELIERLTMDKMNIVEIGFFDNPFKSLEYFILDKMPFYDVTLADRGVRIPNSFFQRYKIKGNMGLLRTDTFLTISVN